MHIQLLDRAFDILELLSREQQESSLGLISAELNLNKSTVYRLLTALESRGYIEKTGRGMYRLGLEFIELSSMYLNHIILKTEAQPSLRNLAKEIDHTVFLAILQEEEAVYIEKIETYNSLRGYSIIGRRAPLHCTALGKVLLSGMTDEELHLLLKERKFEKHTNKTITTVDAIIKEIRRTRQRGWSYDDEEHEDGIRCVGAPVYDYRGHVIAAISVFGHSHKLPAKRIDWIASRVVATANEISRRIGYRGIHGTK